VLRTFVAAEINNKELLDSIKKTQSELDLRAKPINPENMHFTLLFLGEISEQIAYKVQDSLNKIEFSEFDVSFRGIGAFPKARAPRVVWMGTDEEGGKSIESADESISNNELTKDELIEAAYQVIQSWKE